MFQFKNYVDSKYRSLSSNKVDVDTFEFWKVCNYSDELNRWALIDTQNLYKEVAKQGWKIDWKKFKKILTERFCVSRCILFMGYVERNLGLYKYLYDSGFQIWFRKVKELPDGTICGGNVDSDIVVFALEHRDIYSKLIVISDDKDYREFYSCLMRMGKLGGIISSHPVGRSSGLIREIIPVNMMVGIDELKEEIEWVVHSRVA